MVMSLWVGQRVRRFWGRLFMDLGVFSSVLAERRFSFIRGTRVTGGFGTLLVRGGRCGGVRGDDFRRVVGAWGRRF